MAPESAGAILEEHHMSEMTPLLESILDLYLDAAPWLVFGLLMAGLIKAWGPEKGMRRWLGGSGIRPVFAAAVVGAPLPICSCGVLPVAIGLRRAGASRGATTSFMISTPETGVDSVAVSYALLGPFMAVARPVAAVASAVFTGLLVGVFSEEKTETAPAEESTSCCSSSCGEDEGAEEETDPSPQSPPGPWQRVRSGIGYAFTDILDDIMAWLVFGIVLAGIVATLVPQGVLGAWGSGPAAMALMLVVGIPMYICATASTPLAAALLLTGVSPGAVMVFLLAGPATNVATLAVVRKEMGFQVSALYLIGICVSSLAVGVITDAMVSSLAIDINAELSAGAEFVPYWLAAASGALLALKTSGRRMASVLSAKTAAG